jgi:hypothetical protein
MKFFQNSSNDSVADLIQPLLGGGRRLDAVTAGVNRDAIIRSGVTTDVIL